MLNRNALESLNENSLIVDTVTDTKSERSAAQAQPFRSNSLLSAQTETFIRSLLIRRCVIKFHLVQSGTRTIER